jgi:hypothetical protein
VIEFGAETGPTLPAVSLTEFTLRAATTVAAVLQPLNEIVNVMLFDVVTTGVDEHAEIAKSLAVSPLTASLKTRV